ncbi:MAG: phospholipase [Acetobacteraceae bacterium]|jgi:phospholipase C|nr:phospholipase [Acetobacteraceae bacterium]
MPIDHIVVLMMENNGFDRMLGWMGNAGRDVDGVDPAHPRSKPDSIDGGDVLQGETQTRNIRRDPLHYLANSIAQLDGGTNLGFVNDYARTHLNSTPEERREIMAWYPRGFLPALRQGLQPAVSQPGVVRTHPADRPARRAWRLLRPYHAS